MVVDFCLGAPLARLGPIALEAFFDHFDSFEMVRDELVWAPAFLTSRQTELAIRVRTK